MHSTTKHIVTSTRPSRFKSAAVTLSVFGGLFFFVTGCLVDFSEKDGLDTQTAQEADTDDGSKDAWDTENNPDFEDDEENTNTHQDEPVDTDTGGHTASDEGEGTVPQETFCPAGIEFTSKTEFTKLIESSSTEVSTYHDLCADGQVIVGYHGFFRDETDKNFVQGKIQALCATPWIELKDGECVVKTGDTTPLPLRGSVGTREWTRMCPEGEMIVGYQGTTGADIDRISFACAPLLIVPQKNGHTIKRGLTTYLEQAGGDGGNYLYQDECPDDQIATSSVTHTSNILVNGVGMGCQFPSLLY